MNRVLLFFILVISFSCTEAQKDKDEKEKNDTQKNKSIHLSKGLVKDSFYVHDSLGIKFYLSPQWHVFSDQELKDTYRDASKFLSKNNMVLDSSSSVVFFMAKQRNYSIGKADINDALILSLNGDYQSYHILENELQYLRYLKSMYAKILRNQIDKPLEYKDFYVEEIHGKKFHVLEFQIDLGDGNALVEKHYVLKKGSFFYDFNFKYGSLEDHSMVDKMISSIEFKN